MNSIVKFEFEGHQVRVDARESSEWYVAKDVCEALGITNHRDAVASLDDDEKYDVGITDAMGREQLATAISEAGVYQLAFKSRKAAARRFRRWLAHEVIPSIRKNGGYAVPGREQEFVAKLAEQGRLILELTEQNKLLGSHVLELMRRVADRPNGLLGTGAKDLLARIASVATLRCRLGDPNASQTSVDNEVRMIVDYPRIRGAKWKHCPAEVATRAHSYVAGLIDTLDKRIARQAKATASSKQRDLFSKN
jgi:prophage antirepressor-like protein